MRPSSAFVALALLSAPAFVFAASGPPPAKSGPAIIPYLCHDGRVASVVYENGSDFQHARARLTYDDRTVELGAAPTLYGVRYRSADVQPALAWSLRGEEARLTESPAADGYTRQEREIARCVRLRGAPPAEPGASTSHGGGHDADHGEDH